MSFTDEQWKRLNEQLEISDNKLMKQVERISELKKSNEIKTMTISNINSTIAEMREEIAELRQELGAYRTSQNNCGYTTKLDKQLNELKEDYDRCMKEWERIKEEYSIE